MRRFIDLTCALALAITATGAWFVWFRLCPHWAIFSLSAIIAVTSQLFVAVRRPQGLAGFCCWSSVTACWAVFYALSIGPVVATVELMEADPETRSLVGLVYKPVIWLYGQTSLAQPLEHYVELWVWS